MGVVMPHPELRHLRPKWPKAGPTGTTASPALTVYAATGSGTTVTFAPVIGIPR